MTVSILKMRRKAHISGKSKTVPKANLNTEGFLEDIMQMASVQWKDPTELRDIQSCTRNKQLFQVNAFFNRKQRLPVNALKIKKSYFIFFPIFFSESSFSKDNMQPICMIRLTYTLSFLCPILRDNSASNHICFLDGFYKLANNMVSVTSQNYCSS